METTSIDRAIDLSSSIPPATGSSRINVGQKERIASVVAGTALSVLGIRKWNTVYGKALTTAGALLLKRGVTGYCEVNNLLKRNTANKKASALEVKSVFTVLKPVSEVYEYWRNLENLPSFMQHLQSVEVLDERRSSWSARIPGGLGEISWEAVIQDEEPNRLLSWSSLPGSTIDNAGHITFVEGEDNQSTVVTARISYRLPAGDVGGLAGKLINPIVERMIRADLRRFKSLLETGEIQSMREVESKKEGSLLSKIAEKVSGH
jgi:uncharacterized membrane protein